MHSKHIPFTQLQPQTLPPLIEMLVKGDAALDPFIRWKTHRDSFSKALGEKRFSPERRQVLVEVLREQYREIETPHNREAIDMLSQENAYTVVTGHQLNIFSGPAFFIYKLLHTLRLADHINTHFANVRCVPVYWMATEDHDLAEVNHFNAYKERLTWERGQEGAVGRMTTEGLQEVLEQWKDVMRWNDSDERYTLFKRYTEQSNLAAATRVLVNDLFGDRHLLVLDADHPGLKMQFAEIMQREVKERMAEKEVNHTSGLLEKLGFSTQVTPRDINLFYLHEGQRIRLTHDGDEVIGVDSDVRFSHPALLRRIEEEPEKFSPNVTLRPVYQEVILPNLCYIGGPGEMAYWLQLKGLFDALEVDFPILMPRNGAVVLAGHHAKKLRKLEAEPQWLLQREEDLIAQWMEANASQDLELNEAKSAHEKAFQAVIQKVAGVDPTLEGKAEAALQRQLKEYEGLEKAMQRAWKAREETSLRQLKQLHETVWPEGTLQERQQNFFALEQMAGAELLQSLEATFDPTTPGLTFIWPEA